MVCNGRWLRPCCPEGWKPSIESSPIVQILENGEDVFETMEELYGIIWFLAGTYAYRDPRAAVEDARKQYQEGLKKAREVNG
jgi:hypothetical protein